MSNGGEVIARAARCAGRESLRAPVGTPYGGLYSAPPARRKHFLARAADSPLANSYNNPAPPGELRGVPTMTAPPPPPHQRLPQVLLRRAVPRHDGLPRLAAPGRHARRRGRRALRRLLPQLRRRRRRAGARACWRRPGRSRRCSASRPTSPTPTPPSAHRQVERQKAAIDLCVALGIRHCRTLSGQRYPGMTPQRGRRAHRRGHPPLAGLRRAARRRPVPGEPLQGRHLAVPRVRPAGGHLPGDHRPDRVAALRRAVRPVQRHRRRLRPGALPGEGQATGW